MKPSSAPDPSSAENGHAGLEAVLAHITAPAILLEIGEGWTQAPLGNAADLVTKSVETLRNPRVSLKEGLQAWHQLAMIFGDTGAPEICAIIALHAIGEALTAGATDDDSLRLLSTLHSHVNLALLDLKQVRTPDDGSSSAPDLYEFARWVKAHPSLLAKLRPDAQLALLFAAIRAGVMRAPEPFTLEAVRSLPL